MKLRCSVTELDNLQFYLSSEMELSELLARLRKEEAPTDRMVAGRAFHKLLENVSIGDSLDDVLVQDDVTFRFALDADFALPPIRELKGEKVYQIDGVDVTLVGVVDAINGYTIHDHKLTEQFDAERYMDSLQWRCYLDMFGARRFQYNAFEGSQNRDGIYVVRNLHILTFHHYPELTNDVIEALEHFVDVVRDFLPERLAA